MNSTEISLIQEETEISENNNENSYGLYYICGKIFRYRKLRLSFFFITEGGFIRTNT